MRTVLGWVLVVVSLSAVVVAGLTPAPEIDGMSALSAVTLLTGAALVIRSRRK